MPTASAAAPTAAPAAAPEEAVGPLERGLALLRAMAVDPAPRQRPSDLARATGLARSTVDRIATTLVRLGYLRSDGRDLVLAPRAAEFGNAYLAGSRLPELLGPLAVELADRLDESVSIAVPDQDGARFVVQATRRRTMAVSFRIGDLLPAERCAPGALFAAGWDDAQWDAWLRRRQGDPAFGGGPADGAAPAGEGFAVVPARDVDEAEFRERARSAGARGRSVDDQLIEPGLVAVAVPVLDPAGAVVCAVSVVSHTSRHDADSLAAYAQPQLLDSAREMEQRLVRPAPVAAVLAPLPPGRRLKEELGSGFLQSLARGLDVLLTLGTAPGGRPLAAVARATGLPRATARRSLITLQHLGYVAADGEGFRLLPRVLDLGYARLSGLAPAEIAEPHLIDLVRRVHESASMAVLDGPDIRYVARVPTTRIMRLDLAVGTRLPAYPTSMGRVLLGALSEEELARQLAHVTLSRFTEGTVTDPGALTAAIRSAARDGYALVDQELEEGLRSLAAPVHDGRGRVVAAVNLALHAGRGTPAEMLATFLPPLREAAAAIAEDLATVRRWSVNSGS
ncbi:MULTISPECIES: IclR family transcriptional regulator C-terminal domain-containing protein [unclassified Kitasatospora]|uniref:IclR family transcriptional regulator domain-containing protein n=1 Tax=unclassified Kitasatospora TaxID=2633591 RepID=UPI0033F769B9